MNRRQLSTIMKLLVLFFILALSTGCDHWRNHSQSDGNGGGEEIDHDGSGTVDDGGGEVVVPDDNPYIPGVRVVVPPGALDPGQQVTIYIDHMGGLPGPIPGNATQLSDGINITKDLDVKFKLPATVYIPYDASKMEAGDIPGAFYWDDAAQKYIALGVKEIDTENHIISFSSADLGKFVILTIKGLSATLPGIDSGFLPEIDGFFHPNFGAYDYPGSSSFGMASYAEWYYALQKAQDGEGLCGKYLEGDTARWEDDTTARELISRAFADSAKAWGTLWAEPDYKLTDTLTGQELILAMTITGAPQTLVLSGEDFGHTVTVYDYDNETGVFSIYDNNFPKEVVTLKWNPTTGFSDYSKAAAYPDIIKYSFDSYLTAYAVREFIGYYNGAESGWDPSKFNTITVTSPVLDSTNTGVVCESTDAVITGTVSGGLRTAKFIVYSVNGTQGLSGKSIPVVDGKFSFTIPASDLTRTENTIMIMTTDWDSDEDRTVPSAYAGFKEFSLKVEGKTYFFMNTGFETGDFSGWYHETRYIPTMEIVNDRNSFQTAGTDSRVPAIQKVYSGKYSLRVNDVSGGRHVSTVYQTAVVPTSVSFPEIKFYWAAILEKYTPCDSTDTKPYVEVIVYDQTAAQTIYDHRFSPDDQSYSGWQELAPADPISTERWVYMPWQVVIVDCASLKGHTLLLKVTASDSSKSAHGGYLYLDGID